MQRSARQPNGAQAQASADAQKPSLAERRQRWRERREAVRAEWWSHAREVLFSGIELSDRQSRQVDALIDDLLWQRSRESEIEAELRAARRRADAERAAALGEEQKQLEQKSQSRQEVFEEMRSLLSEAQRPAFDMNRARLAAEHQAREMAPREGPISVPRSPSS